jgi:enoyl-CoA hydratase/carnithine racemase
MPFSFAALLNYKLPSSKMVREVCLEAKRYTGKELHDVGVVDILAENGSGVLNAARDLAAQREGLAKSGVWGLMKVRIFILLRICAELLLTLFTFAEGSHATNSGDCKRRFPSSNTCTGGRLC